MTAPRAGRGLGWLHAVVVLAMVAAASQAPAAGGATAAVQDAGRGEELFLANCAVCHGPWGEGTGAAAPLGGVVDRLGRERVEATIRDGRGGMPSFGDQLTDAEIARVGAHLDNLTPLPAAPDERRGGPWRAGRWPMMWEGMMAGWGWLVMLLWALFSVALLVLVILAVLWLARNVGSDRGQVNAGAPTAGGVGAAREALDLRYARGEIGREEYLQAREDLDGPHG